jgi:hypothetical protein
MKVSTADRQGRWAKRKKNSLRATWKVLRGLTFNHFPLILPGVYPLLAPLIMFRLKRRGFSNCRVDVSGNGLIVHAER